MPNPMKMHAMAEVMRLARMIQSVGLGWLAQSSMMATAAICEIGLGVGKRWGGGFRGSGGKGVVY